MSGVNLLSRFCFVLFFSLKCYYDLLNTKLAKFLAMIFIQRLSTLSVSFGFHVRHYSRSKLSDWTSEGWIWEKVSSFTYQLRISACKCSLYKQNASLKSESPRLPFCILIQPRTHALHLLGPCKRLQHLLQHLF